MKRGCSSPRRARKRSGIAMVFVLMVMGVVMALFATWSRQTLRETRQVHRAERQLQAAWFVEAGLERAAGRLAADSAYQGETWRVAVDESGPEPQRAEVVIRVAAQETSPSLRMVSVEVEYLPDSPSRARAEKQVVMNLSVLGVKL